MKIWVVSVGSYREERAESVFDAREKALDHLRELDTGEGYRFDAILQQFELNTPEPVVTEFFESWSSIRSDIERGLHRSEFWSPKPIPSAGPTA